MDVATATTTVTYFSLDKILLEFISGNWLSLYILITLLKGIAIMTPGVKDDKVVTLISNIYNALRGGKAPEAIETTEEKKDE